MNKNRCHAYAASFCSVKLNNLTADLTAVITFFFFNDSVTVTHCLFYFAILLGSLVEYKV